MLIGPDADVPDQVVAGRRVLGWLPLALGRRLVLRPRTPASARWDRPLREHRDVSGGWLRPAVFGAMHGLVTNSSLIAGIGGGGGGHGAIVLTGIAGLIAGAFSMATGEYISVTSQNELTAAEVELERMQHLRDPAGKRDRLAEIFMDKEVSRTWRRRSRGRSRPTRTGRSPPTCARSWESTRTTCRHRAPPRRRRSPPSPSGT